MNIDIISHIEEIPREDWLSLELDFALSDGIYDYAYLNEKINSSIKPRYIKVVTETFQTFCLLNEVTTSILNNNSDDTWFYDFIRNYFGDVIVNKFKNENYSKINLIILPQLSKEISTFLIDNVNAYLSRISEFENSLIVYNSFHEINSVKYYHSIEQKPYMFFDLEGINDYEDFIEIQKSKIKNNIRRDKNLLIKNDIVIDEINFKEFSKQILALNQTCKYPALEDSIRLISQLEKSGNLHTFGFFKNDTLVQYLTLFVENKISYLMCVNMGDEIKEWSGILNTYNIFAEKSLMYDVKYAYVGFECVHEKEKRGAKKLIKFFIY